MPCCSSWPLHVYQSSFAAVSGNTIAKVQAGVMVALNTELPIGWDVPSMVALNVHGLQLAKEGRYAIEISADSIHLRTLNLRTKVTSPAKTGN